MLEIKLQPLYPISLILSTAARKTCESLAKSLEMNGDKLYSCLKNVVTNTQDLLDSAKKFFGKKSLYLIIDDTLLQKIYSRNIEGTSDNYDSADHKTYRSLCSVTAMLTDESHRYLSIKKLGHQRSLSITYKKKTSFLKN